MVHFNIKRQGESGLYKMQAVIPGPVKRETGERPVRTRHCNCEAFYRRYPENYGKPRMIFFSCDIF